MQPHRDVFICLGLKRIPRGRRTRSVMALDGGPPAINPSDSPMDISPRSSAARVLTNLLATSDEAPIAAAPHGFQRRSKKKFACTPTFSDPDRAYEDEGHTSDATDGGQERSSLSNSYPSPDRVAPSPPPPLDTPELHTWPVRVPPHDLPRLCAFCLLGVPRCCYCSTVPPRVRPQHGAFIPTGGADGIIRPTVKGPGALWDSSMRNGGNVPTSLDNEQLKQAPHRHAYACRLPRTFHPAPSPTCRPFTLTAPLRPTCWGVGSFSSAAPPSPHLGSFPTPRPLATRILRRWT